MSKNIYTNLTKSSSSSAMITSGFSCNKLGIEKAISQRLTVVFNGQRGAPDETEHVYRSKFLTKIIEKQKQDQRALTPPQDAK